jgi:CheY-like chemotaxis protein
VSQRTVLIVDDNPVNLELYAELVGLTDYQARLVDRAEEVLAAARAAAPSLILLDLTLPNSSGFDVAAKLKAEPATAGVPIIALTAVQRDSLHAELQRAGFVGLISKPCGVETFLDALTWGMEGEVDGFRVFG